MKSEQNLEISETGICRSFLTKFGKDLRNKETWKLKAVYFFFLSGLVMIWVQLTVHQSSLNFSDRDVANFISMGTIVPMVITLITGVIADKIGNFSKFVASLIILLGVMTFCFTLIKPVNLIENDCELNKLKSFKKVIQSAENSTSLKERINACNNVTIFRSESDTLNWSCDSLSDVKNSIFETVLTQALFEDCGNASKTKNYNSYVKTYWTYFTVYASFMVLASSSYTLYDGTVMALQKETSIDYGLQRAWGTIPALISSYLGGFLVDANSIGLAAKDFTLMFFGSAVCIIIAGLITFTIDISVKLPATHFSKDLWNDLRNFELASLLILIVFKGLFMGYIETFMYLFLSKLGASSSLIGLTVTVGAVVEIGLQLLSTPITNLLGKTAVISIGLLCYSVRFIGLSYLYNPVNILYLELLDSWATGLSMTAIIMSCTKLSSTTTIASIRGLVTILHDGIGRCLGSQIGITIKDSLGDRVTWRVMSVAALIITAIYYTIMKLFKVVKQRKLSCIFSKSGVNCKKDTREENCHGNAAFQA